MWHWWHRNGSIPFFPPISMKNEFELMLPAWYLIQVFHSWCVLLCFFFAHILLIGFTLRNFVYCYRDGCLICLGQRLCVCLSMCSSFPAVVSAVALTCPYAIHTRWERKKEMKTSTSRQTTMTLQETGLFRWFDSHNVCTLVQNIYRKYAIQTMWESTNIHTQTNTGKRIEMNERMKEEKKK